MLNLKKKLLIGLLSASMVLSVGQTAVWSADNDSKDDSVSIGDTGDKDEATVGDTGDKDEEVVHITEDEALAEMKVYAENDKYVLYFNEETAIFAVKVKSNGYIWWSSPYDAENDPIAKGAQVKTMNSLFYVNAGDAVNHRTSKTTAYDAAIKNGDFTIEKIDNGMKIVFNMSNLGITVPVRITLGEKSLDVEVLTSEIVEEDITSEDGACLVDITLLASFGAASTEENGYMVIPDGSGAVINFNNQRNNSTVYDSKVYGRDLTIGQLTSPAISEQIYMPVIGMVKKGENGDNGMIAVVDQGDAYANVRASISGSQSTTSYNQCWFDFDLRSTDTFYMGSNNNTELVVYEAGNIKVDNIKVKYYMFDGDDLSYVDLADTYRNYLTDEKNVGTKTTAEHDAQYYLTLYGGTMKAQSVAGFPVELETAATTYSQAQEIIAKLSDSGISDMVITYDDCTGTGVVGRIATGFDYSGTLGGKDAYTSLSQYVSEKGYELFPSLDIMEYNQSGNGYSFSMNASKQISKAYATQTAYDLAFGIPHQTKAAWMVLSPWYYNDIFTKIINSFNSENIDGISLKQAASTLYSDFSRTNDDGRDYLVRGDAQNELIDGYKRLKDEGKKIIAEECNAYMFPYVDYITDVPLYSSNYDIFDYDIPFYELVIHGLIPYTSKATNASADSQDLFLLSIATGTPLHYSMMYNDPNKFTDSEYDDLFYASYSGKNDSTDGWLQRSVCQYNAFKAISAGLGTQTIADYEYDYKTGAIKSTFSDGTVIEVNLEDETIALNGTQINLADYGLEGDDTNE